MQKHRFIYDLMCQSDMYKVGIASAEVYGASVRDCEAIHVPHRNGDVLNDNECYHNRKVVYHCWIARTFLEDFKKLRDELMGRNDGKYHYLSADLCDIVTVEDVTFGLRVKLEITEVTYDVLRDRYTNMVVGSRQKTIPELIKKQNEIEFKRINTSLTQVADVSKKATVEHKVYPTNYDPAHPESWDDKYTGKLVDKDGKEVEQIGTINRKPIFVHTGGGGTVETAPILFFTYVSASSTFHPDYLNYTIPYSIIKEGTVRQETVKPKALYLGSVTFPVDYLKANIPFEFITSGWFTITDKTLGDIKKIPCTFYLSCTPKIVDTERIECDVLMKQVVGHKSDKTFLCSIGFVYQDSVPEDEARVLKAVPFRKSPMKN